MTSQPTDLQFVELSRAQIARLSDADLAQAYTRAVLLNHRARLEGMQYRRTPREGLPTFAATSNLHACLEQEIQSRGKTWQVSMAGDSWLEDRVAQQ